VRPRTGLLLYLAGFAASALLVAVATRAGTRAGVVEPAGPFGLWRPASTGRDWYGLATAAAIGALAVVFVRLYRRAADGELGVRAVARIAALWCVPTLLGPPLLSLDAYSYVAQGRMLLAHLDPYAGGPERLGPGPVLDAVAPIWRDTPTPYGPLALTLLRFVALLGGGNLPATVYLLRLVAVLAVAGAAVATVRLADPGRRAAALALVAANPLVVVHLVGGVHLDALLAGLAAVTVLAVRNGWYAVAALAAATAFAVKAPGVILVAYVLLSAARAAGVFAWRTAGAAGVVAGTSAGAAALVPDGWGWVAALRVPGRVHHPWDPATVLGWLFHLVTRVDKAQTLGAGRVVAAVAGAVVVAVLVWRAAGRPGDGAARLGGALETAAFTAPAIYPWYPVWGLGLVCAAASARARWWMVAASVALCFTALPDPLPHHPLARIGFLAAALAGAYAVAARSTQTA